MRENLDFGYRMVAGVATLRFARPEVLNALASRMTGTVE